MRSLLTILFGVTTLCHATTLFTVTAAPDTLSGNPGDFFQFFGSLTNNTASTVFINNDSFTFAIVGAADDSPFLTDAPLSLGPFASSGSFEFIDVTIPLAQAPGTYDGTLTVIGGADGNAQDNLGAGAFHVVVNAAAVPEPGPMLLVGVGLAVLWLVSIRIAARRPPCATLFRFPEEIAGHVEKTYELPCARLSSRRL
jgi:hypothetical protein